MTSKVEISNAEWELMRLLWTLGHATSRQLSEILAEKFSWKTATVKTLLHRLIDKQIIRSEKHGRAFMYYPNVGEQSTIDQQVMNAMDKICQMHVGQTLNYILKQVPLSQADIKTLQQTLVQKQKDAPEILECNCLPSVNCKQ